ncbi:dipeptide/oligopeptide/nickel ABC transporter permease/ATP-binding protein [Planomonospora venezuelensis]|uniref:Peptide/nickel transport system permease protein n=1 Tax=Planomonospora venezuelensis TaxID=1999 RepID=A0A841D005_PLAVE|nr:dipeptide/oligopeptide/nickel ABC transporter permease/ATP-binding protein [Planomonospora venezuelensis]MBB5961577.1 peptide/nickel transport system permease protein [Planomonospora venezuelensis]GIM98723.1 ABC transporter [Planomonospora venezuelensis]
MFRSQLTARLSRPGIRFSRLSPAALVSLAILAAVGLLAAAAPLVAGDPLATGVPATPPDAEHWFGTDRAGRDVLARVVHGARSSLLIGLGATAVAVLAGAVLGSLAATSRKLVGEGIMRVLDVVMSFPGIALAAVLVAVFGRNLPVLIGTIAFLYVPQLTRVVRANVLAQYGEDYVAAERVIGAPRRYILVRHVAVNCAAPIMVFATVLVADAIIFEASLSFIGAGIQDPAPSWGNVLAYGRQIVLSGGWWATFFPGLAILVTVLALNLLAEGLTDAWAAPRTALRKTRQAAGLPAAEAATAVPAADSVVTGLADGARADSADAVEAVPPGGAAPVDEAPGSGPDAGVQAALARLAAVTTGRAPRVAPLPPGAATLLSVRDLTIRFPQRYGDVPVVQSLSFDVRAGETLGLVGESGCGKSLTSLAIMGLLPRGAQAGGSIEYGGRDILALPPRQRRAISGPEIAMVYQDAMSSLNPSVLAGTQLRQLTRRGGTRSPEELLELVGLDPRRTLRSYPHELSGGQRQRVLIAMALSRSPRLLVADEPTTALDVTVQAQVVELLGRLRDELGFAMVLVSHDLGLVGELAHRIAVMYAGQLAEAGTAPALFSGVRHHYARGLLGSVLSLEAGAERLHQVPGVVPAPQDFGPGCRFAGRCAAATGICRTTRPELDGDPHVHAHACFHPGTVRAGERLQPSGAHEGGRP